MQKYLFFLLILPWATFSQTTISGIVQNNRDKTPLPFANIITDSNYGTITDIEGKFELPSNIKFNTLTISYVGFQSVTVPFVSSKNFYAILLEERTEQLKGVVLTGGENPALRIIRNTIRNRKSNNPEKILNSYAFKAYNKLLVTADPKAINGAVDSIFDTKNNSRNFLRVDSSNYKFKRQIERSHLYLSEKISDYAYTASNGKRETVLASRMAGFKQPIYDILLLQIQSFSFYENKYTILGTEYVNPIASNALRVYDYKILDTVSQNSRDAYMIYYYPKKKGDVAGLEGVLYIDTETYAIQKAIAQLKAVIDIKASQTFEYRENEKVWFPINKEVKIKKGENDDGISLFGMALNFGSSPRVNDSTLTHTNDQNEVEFIQLISTEKNFEIQLNQPLKIRGKGLDIDLTEKAGQRDEAYWKKYRTDSITKRDRETYVVVDSIVDGAGLENSVAFIRKILDGYFPTKYIDFDLKFLIKYNDFEGFKPGIGIITNDEFSTKVRLFAYGIYGFRDEDFKYGGRASVRLDRFTDTWLGVSYIDDLGETANIPFNTDGRAFYVFEPRLFNITSFFKVKRISPFIEHDLTAKIKGKLQLNHSTIDPQFEYTFITDDAAFSNFNLTTGQLTFQWDPNNEYILTPQGKRTAKQAYPKLTLQATQSFDNVFGSDFNFTKFDFRAIHELVHLNGSATNFFVRAGIGFGDIPLTHLFSFSPNSSNDDTIFGRFSVADINSFETLFFNEFFADRYATFQVRHRFNRFKISKRFRPELVLASRAAFGSVENRERHLGIDFNTLEDGFYESGFELNKLFFGFGLSFFYRYGPNGLPDFEDNISLKFTFNFDFGF